MDCPKCGKLIGDFTLRDPGPSTFKCHACGWSSDNKEEGDSLVELEPKCPECDLPLVTWHKTLGPNIYLCPSCRWRGTDPYKTTRMQLEEQLKSEQAQAKRQLFAKWLQEQIDFAAKRRDKSRERCDRKRHRAIGNDADLSQYREWTGALESLEKVRAKLEELGLWENPNEGVTNRQAHRSSSDQTCPSCGASGLLLIMKDPGPNAHHCILCGWEGSNSRDASSSVYY